MPLVDKDHLIRDYANNKDFLQTFKQIRDDYLNGKDTYGIWESNLPHYCLPSVNVFPEVIRLCAENYDVQHRAVKSPSGSILFFINADSINQMLNFSQTELLFPFSMNYLLDAGAKMTSEEIQKNHQDFYEA